jgi:hypothetical protein
MRVLIEMIHPGCVKKGGSALYPVNNIVFVQQKFGQICAVLAGYAGD